MNILVVIPARGGSKGIPRKNIKPLNGRPLIYYTLDVARGIVPDANICVSTDDDEIIQVVKDYGIEVPFKRPANLATDTAETYKVLLHALNFFEERGHHYDVVLLLQNTSPFRKIEQVKEALQIYTHDLDMVVSVKECSANPYYCVFEENEKGFLKIAKGKGNFGRRQDAPKVYEYNGAIYVINPVSLKKMALSQFSRRKKYVMDELTSLDLDTMLDWKIAEIMMQENA